MNDETPDVQKIPIEQSNVLNLRRRNKFIFQGIVSNISNIGLKKPITVARRAQPLNGKIYDLVDGHGRLEACIALGQTEIPAIITDASEEECLLYEPYRVPAAPGPLSSGVIGRNQPTEEARAQGKRDRKEDQP
jgi:hypothetical protein